MSELLDPTRPVRDGEELDTEALTAYIRTHLAGAEEGAGLEIEQFPSGHSNLTYLLRFGDRELVLRRPPFGNRVATAHDMGREHRVLEKLHAVWECAPRPFLFCDDEAVIGAPFYLMERRRGVVIRKQPPAALRDHPETLRRLCESFVDTLASLHTLDAAAAGLGDLGRPAGYVERQVRGWIGRYEKAKTDDWRELEELGRWLDGHQPGDSGVVGLVHNDFKYDNLVLDPGDLTRIVAVLDWEMCTLGDPLMDLGTTLAYWVEAGDGREWQALAFGPTALPGSFTRREVVARYAERTGFDVGNVTFYFAYGVYKLAVILQQIYYRYAKGFTRDPRFAEMNRMVALLGRFGARAVERESV